MQLNMPQVYDMKRFVLIILVVLLVLGAGLGFAIYKHGQKTPEEIVRSQISDGNAETAMSQSQTADGGSDEATSQSKNRESGKSADSDQGQAKGNPEPYVSPVDFELLRKQNSDICAWIDIPDTNISYPVLKNDAEPDFYLSHDSLKNDSIAGALYVDEYNERDFQDNATVIYGHHMSYGEFFGKLQSYYQDEESFRKNSRITLYLPVEKRTYKVFAAVPYEKIHLLYNYDFSNMLDHYVFFDRVYQVRSLVAQFDKKSYPEFGEKVLILSTCLEGDNTQRYLVMGKEVKGE